MKPVGLMDVRQALLADDRFQNLFPEMKAEIDKFLKDPRRCGSCVVPLAKEILNHFPDRVEKYFPGRLVIRPEDESKKLAEHNYTIINCHINELEEKLRRLPAGGKRYLSLARFEDQVTVIVDEIAFNF